MNCQILISQNFAYFVSILFLKFHLKISTLYFKNQNPILIFCFSCGPNTLPQNKLCWNIKHFYCPLDSLVYLQHFPWKWLTCCCSLMIRTFSEFPENRRTNSFLQYLWHKLQRVVSGSKQQQHHIYFEPRWLLRLLSCQRQRRHQRVKTWTRHVDIFKKDFLFVPVNHEWVQQIKPIFFLFTPWTPCASDIPPPCPLSAHWYLAIVCFPGLTAPTPENGNDSEAAKSNGAAEESRDQESLHRSGRTDDRTENTPSVINRVGGNPDTGRFDGSQDALSFYYTFVQWS